MKDYIIKLISKIYQNKVNDYIRIIEIANMANCDSILDDVNNKLLIIKEESTILLDLLNKMESL